ncbi:hypothetical protein [Glutamicibacter sp. V16R2B1]|uniref:hypothetical protein n=1 Tax=Glutamicibacter sp. V16R2B1 TaxID=2036207 RepID=UPI0010FF3C3E|nr:hypothetical protein [Glutamicibacter sp. V16R2B1]MCK9901278.1 hypothetical protein [Frankia sp. Cpl3]TLK47408.1 hypothetical protein FDN03_15830 [Glutamicibacter sp. V16R2B1]
MSFAIAVPAPQLDPPAVSLVRAASRPQTADDRWALDGVTYLPEVAAQVILGDPCGPAGVGLAAIVTPTSGTSASGGTLTADTYGYKVTALSQWGEGLPSAEVTQTTTGSTSTVTLTWTAVAGAEQYRVYGRTSGGPWGLLATVSAPTVSWTDTGSASVGAAPPTADTSGTYSYTAPGVVEWMPYSVSAYDRCTLMTASGRDFVGRATRLLEAATPKAVEREFWDGTRARTAGLGNRYLTKQGAATVVNPTPGTAVSFTRGLLLLEQALADSGFGAPGMVHCRPEALDDTAQLFRRTGNLILTSRDTIVVPGVGYSGRGPAGDSNEVPAAGKTWMFATGLVEYRETPAAMDPGWTSGGQPSPNAIDRNINMVTAWARKTALASWDGQAHYAVLVDLPA